MKKTLIGLGLGSIAGVVDVIPMIILKLPLSADISAFTFWVVSGFLIVHSEIKIKPFFKGVLISYLVLIPSAVLVGASDPKSLIPMSIMALILGGLLGVSSARLSR